MYTRRRSRVDGRRRSSTTRTDENIGCVAVALLSGEVLGVTVPIVELGGTLLRWHASTLVSKVSFGSHLCTVVSVTLVPSIFATNRV